MNNIDRYTQLDASFALGKVDCDVSEAHGAIVGAISNHLFSGKTPDLGALILGQDSESGGSVEHVQNTLSEVYRDTSEALFNADENFDLLLLDDDAPLSQRTEALAGWCKGYVLGLLYNDAFGIDQLGEAGPEIVRDIMQISELTSDDIDETENVADDEKNLTELHEYVRVGVQLVFEFIYEQRAQESNDEVH